MNITLWILAILLCLVFLAAGLSKVAQPREKLIASGMGWVADVSPGAVKALGAVEALGAIGLVLPAAVNVAPILVAWAALGLAVTMLGAVVLHVRRCEVKTMAPSVILLLLAATVAWGRFGPYQF